jgi:hypothetical protein
MEFWNKSVNARCIARASSLDSDDLPPAVHPLRPEHGAREPCRLRRTCSRATPRRGSGSPGQPSRTRGRSCLIRALRPWRAEWVTSGLYNDGWTKPGRAGTVRILRGAGTEAAHDPPAHVGDPGPSRSSGGLPRRLESQGRPRIANGIDRVVETLAVCVPARGYTDVRVTTPEHRGSGGTCATRRPSRDRDARAACS